MDRTRRPHPSSPTSFALAAVLIALAAALLAPAGVKAQETYTFTVGALGGIGGSLDASPGDELDNTGYQINLGMVTQPMTHVVLRLGKLGLGGGGPFGDLNDADLSYATLGGEYHYRHSYYDSGLYLALGGYRLQGTDGAGRDATSSTLGLAIGTMGEFSVTRNVSILVEFSGHWADFDQARFFAVGHVGVGYHF